MTAFLEPTKWAQSLGATANADVIPDEAGAMDVDISKIFPAVFSVPLAQGGKAIPRRTLNGIFKTLGEWAFFNQNGGVPSYNADFDYTVGRLISYNSGLYKCIQDNVHTAPHNPTDTDYWVELSDSSDIDNIATDLHGKADRSLSNIDSVGKIAIADNAYPDGTHIDLVAGTSGTTYTAPASGYFYALGTATTDNGFLSFALNGYMTSGKFARYTGSTVDTSIPASRGSTVSLNYGGVSITTLRFYYAKGAH